MIKVPDVFLDNPKSIKLPTLSLFHYFNRDKSERVEIQLNTHMLLYIFHGSKTVQTDTITLTISNEDALFIAKGQYIMSEILSLEEGSFDGVMVFFDDSFLLQTVQKFSQFLPSDSPSKPLFLCKIKQNSILTSTMQSIREYIDVKPTNDALIYLKFEEVFLQLIDFNNSKQLPIYLSYLYKSSLYKLKTSLEKNEFSSVQEMIKFSKLSEKTFRYNFEKLYATTPKEWLLQRALQKAKLLLQTKDLNVSEVGLECGFHSLSWFIKSFKAHYGMTPKKFQQNC